MAIHLDEWELVTLRNPASFYEAITSARGYSPRPAAVEDDGEFVVTEYAVLDCLAVCATLVHSKKEAYLVLLSSEDCTAMSERLGTLQIELSSLKFARATWKQTA